MMTTSRYDSHEQHAAELPAGEGEYQNPFPTVLQGEIEPKTESKSPGISYWVDAWKELEFPITMSKPQIMEAATRAMALKIFDDLGVLPGKSRNADPLIVGRLIIPALGQNRHSRHVSFIIAWHLNTATL